MVNKKKRFHFSSLKLFSVKTEDLKKKDIISICKLKNSYWKWTIKNQINWFKKNVKKKDINVMLISNEKLVGYTLLRKRKAYNDKKKLNYLYFDTFMIDQKFRNKGLGEKLIKFNNNIIKKSKKHSFLICPKKVIPFYNKFGWKVLKKNKFKVMDHKSNWFTHDSKQNGMTYELNKREEKIFYFFNS